MESEMRVSAEMAARIKAEIDGLRSAPVGHMDHEGTLHDALALFGTIGEVWLLRADGSLWRADSDFGLALEPLPDNWRTIALVAGTQRYPWLRGLLPPRPVDAVQCRDCGGLGRVGPEKVLFCRTCDALGWRPVGD